MAAIATSASANPCSFRKAATFAAPVSSTPKASGRVFPAPLLNPLLRFAPNDPVDVAPRRVDAVLVDLAQPNELLDLGDHKGRARCHHRVEVPGRLAVHEVPEGVSLVRFDQRQVRKETSL